MILSLNADLCHLHLSFLQFKIMCHDKNLSSGFNEVYIVHIYFPSTVGHF